MLKREEGHRAETKEQCDSAAGLGTLFLSIVLKSLLIDYLHYYYNDTAYAGGRNR
jgi:hypothetical protein